MRRFLLLPVLTATAFILSGCGDNRSVAERQADDKAFSQSHLPEGCTFHDAGNYSRGFGKDYPIFVVICPHSTTTTSTHWQTGGKHKTNHYTSIAAVSP